MVALGGPGDLVARKVVDVRLALRHKVRDDVAAHVVAGILVLLVFQQRLNERLGGEAVVAHRRVGHLRVVQGAGRVGGLFQKLGDRAVVVRLDAAERVRLRARYPDASHGGGLAGRDVVLHHLRGVHAVHVVRA